MASQIGLVQDVRPLAVAYEDEALGVPDRQRAQQQAVENREDGRVCADPRASDRIATAVTMGVALSARKASRMSCMTVFDG